MKRVFILICAVLLIGSLATPKSPVGIKSSICRNFTSPGAYEIHLENDNYHADTSPCFNVQSDGVYILCSGHIAYGQNPNFKTGIAFRVKGDNVKIQYCGTRNFSVGLQVLGSQNFTSLANSFVYGTVGEQYQESQGIISQDGVDSNSRWDYLFLRSSFRTNGASYYYGGTKNWLLQDSVLSVKQSLGQNFRAFNSLVTMNDTYFDVGHFTNSITTFNNATFGELIED